jgi:dTDP-glucose 4,6-dehydratase
MGEAGFLGSSSATTVAGSLQNVEQLRREEFLFVGQDVSTHIESAEQVEFVYQLARPTSPINYARLLPSTLKVGSYGTHDVLGLARQGSRRGT